jgi:ParB-like chromosome segregation protein Spo0J
MAKQAPYRLTKIEEIKPYDRNPRIIPQAAVDAVAKSIQAFGFRQPIVVDGNGVILAGHTRYRAALQLGLSEVPVVWQTDISAIQAQGYRIADNKTAELSAWDRDALDTEVKDIAAHCDADLDALGLADWELERILQETQVSGLPEEEQKPFDTPLATSQIAPSPSTASTASDEAAPIPDIKDNVLSIYYSLSELQELADALGLEPQVVQRRRSYTVGELIAAQKEKCEE